MNLAALGRPWPDAAADPDDAFPQAFAAALRSLHVAAGGDPRLADAVAHVATCVARGILEGQTSVEVGGAAAPDIAGIAEALATSPVIGHANGERAGAPLLAEHGRVWLARYREYQRAFAASLAALNRAADGIDESALRKLLDRHFRGTPATPDWQKVAAATAVLRHLCVISGGPGTGKTATVVKILAILLTLQPQLKVAIAAPTGKAAARVQDAIRQALDSMKLPAGTAGAMPREPHTVHRLLGYRPGHVSFRHGAGNPLPYDVIVVDEASMLDLALAAKLITALRPDARLILLGDKDQLSSVEAGAVFAGVSSSRTMTRSWRAHLAALTGETLPSLAADDEPLRNAVVWLEHSYRFGSGSPLGQLAAAINSGAAERVGELLGAGDPALEWVAALPAPRVLAERLAEGYAAFAAAVAAGRPPPEVFAAFDAYRVLCSTRAGQYGSARIAPYLLESLRRRLGVPFGTAWFAGRPVLVTSNDYALRLFNGDVGIALPDGNGRLMVHFQEADGTLRAVSPTRLGNVDDALAITVHRAQGSEFDRVAIVVEPELVRGLSRALVYTAVTRARSGLQIWGPVTTMSAS